MSRGSLERLLCASENDAVLASWAKVLIDYNVGAHCDVPPYEHWEAFQEFFSCGLLSALQFDSIDVKQEFFSGRRPRQIDIQSVLDNTGLQHTNEQMSKAKPPIEAFSSTSSIVRKKSPGKLSRTIGKVKLKPRRVPSSLAAFSPENKGLPSNTRDKAVDKALKEVASLACNQSVDARSYIGGLGMNGHITCCGKPLETIEEGGDIISPEDLPQSEDHALIEYMFHAECKNCKSIYHVTCGKPIPRDSY